MGQGFGCVQVQQSTVAVKEHFGKFDGVLQPGFHYVPWCGGYGVAGKLSLRVEQLWIKCQARTKDNVFLQVTISIHYRPSKTKVQEAFYNLKDTTHHIQSYVFGAVIENVAKWDLDAVYKEKNHIENVVQETLVEAMCIHGYEMVKFILVDLERNGSVKNAVKENAE